MSGTEQQENPLHVMHHGFPADRNEVNDFLASNYKTPLIVSDYRH
jgi:hypothetical protein